MWWLPINKGLRVHTRMPVVVPERVTDRLLHTLTATRLQPVVVVHVNHANELGPAARQALARLANAGMMLLNQSVLLAGVNDNLDALVVLSESLMSAGVLPYYLHLLDHVKGAAHFEVSEATALALHRRLRSNLPGYLVPRLVREEPGAPAKRLVCGG